jgi:O-antigen/teichoic acid export membrane protein
LLSPTAYGAYSAVLVTVTIIATVPAFGLSTAAARFVALFEQDERSWSSARAIFSLTLIFSFIATLLFASLSPYLSLYITHSTQWAYLFVIGSLWLFANSISLVAQGIAQGLKRYVSLAKILMISKVAMVAFTIVGLELYHSVTVAVLSWVIFNGIIVIGCFGLFGYRFLMATDTPGPYIEILRYASPLGVASILSTVSSYADLVIVGGYLNLISLGIYNLAVQISMILSLVVILPLTTALLPELASVSGNDNQISNGLRLAIRFLVLSLLPASLIIAGVSSQLLTLFSGGGVYLAGLALLEIIAITYIFVGIQTAIFTLLQATGHTIQALIVAGVSAVVDIVGAALLIPNDGLIGAALTKALVGFLSMIAALYLVRNYHNGLDSKVFYFKAVLASVVPFVTVFALSLFISNRTLSIVPYVLIGGLLFLGCVKILKILNDEDRAFIAHLLPPSLQKMVRYL